MALKHWDLYFLKLGTEYRVWGQSAPIRDDHSRDLSGRILDHPSDRSRKFSWDNPVITVE